jgi:Raf kinase inhibitor-like YbhB/YbcL family protein
MAEFELTSPAFERGQPLPRKHTCEGEDVSPPLSWSGVPEGTGSLALVVNDPDAPSGTFTHWLSWGIDPGAGNLAEGETPPIEGRNDFGSSGWRGPCPPPGHGPHRYFFRLYALEGELDLPAGAGKAEVEQAIAQRVLAAAELGGTYER